MSRFTRTAMRSRTRGSEVTREAFPRPDQLFACEHLYLWLSVGSNGLLWIEWEVYKAAAKRT